MINPNFLAVPPPIVLLTDFGDRDGYSGVMKGVIAGICPGVTVIDLSHHIPPQNVRAAQFCLARHYAYFPQRSIFLCVVDPGVGSDRRAIAVGWEGGYYVGPDNGLGTSLWERETINQCVVLPSQDGPGQTFHGRDCFAPAAARLAVGEDIVSLGDPLDPSYLVRLSPLPLTVTPDVVIGTLMDVDHFGNLMTNIPGDFLSSPTAQVQYRDQWLPVVSCYSAQSPGSPLALVGSHGFVEIAIYQGNAQHYFQAIAGDKVTVFRNNGGLSSA